MKHPNCPASYLSDSPSNEDTLGSHDRVANAIFLAIATQEGGKVIGLEGAWGSGKSTVVSLLKTRLGQSAELRPVIFDAWAHEGDHLRRAFLESTARQLEEYGWVDKERSRRMLDRIAGRRRETTVQNIPHITVFAKLFLLSLLGVPFGVAVLNSGLPNAVPWLDPGLPVEVKTLVGAALVLLPATLLVLAELFVDKGKGAGLPGWSLLAHSSSATVTTETSQEPEPTSLEFEREFNDLLGEALNQVSRRLVLVIDNLDRVSADDSLAIWSTLRGFLEPESGHDRKWFAQSWVLVPYDRSGLTSLLRNRGGSRGTEYFLDKTIQVKFHVPRIILSSWRSYLMGLLAQAFPSHSEPEFHAIYMLQRSKFLRGQTPSPRELKRFVNDIVALHEQWGHDIPLSDFAFYLLLKQDGRDVAERLLQEQAIDLPDPVLVSGSVLENTAAIAFNVPIAIARQILLEGPVLNAMSAQDCQALSDLVQENPGFWSVLEKINFTSWGSTKPSLDVCSVAGSFAECSALMDPRQGLAISTAIRSIQQAIRTNQIWKGDTKIEHLRICAEKLVAFFRRAPDLQTLSKTTTELARLNPATEAAGAWTDALLLLLEANRSLHPGPIPFVDGNLADDAAVRVAARLSESDPGGKYWQAFRPAIVGNSRDWDHHFDMLRMNGRFGAKEDAAQKVIRAIAQR